MGLQAKLPLKVARAGGKSVQWRDLIWIAGSAGL
jgi:hypothetical protein